MLLALAATGRAATPQRARLAKLSPWLRRVVPVQVTATDGALRAPAADRRLCAFVQVEPGGEAVLADHGGRSLAAFGDIHIAELPLSRVAAMTLDRRVRRIEASPSHRVLNDTVACHLGVLPVRSGAGLPQAFDGSGVVVGVVDIGFDLTHPAFRTADATAPRIRRFWDQLSADTVGSSLFVGRDYAEPADILALGHSRDGLDFTHGTHTLATAAGAACGSPYGGMAPGADLCLVANAVTDNAVFIDSIDIFKFTYATDALAFKYIFDYADAVGKPCVVSFSEGSPQDLYGYDLLYYAVLDSLTGPGHILVASAGNEGQVRTWLHKPRGRLSAGTFLRSAATSMGVVLTSADDFDLRFVAYGDVPDTLVVPSRSVCLSADSTLLLTLPAGGRPLHVELTAYPSCYDPLTTCYDCVVSSPYGVGGTPRLSLELVGSEADVELWRVDGALTTYAENPALSGGEPTHCVMSPSSAPAVVSVGATSYRDRVATLRGDTLAYWPGTGGVRAPFSSVGPTMDGRTKPDVMAPGNNVISAYSSFYMEAHPDAEDLRWTVQTFPFEGRTYGWTSAMGTSMSAPAVAGGVALWLQACPTLSPVDVMGLFRLTCHRPDPLDDYPNNRIGFGEMDVFRGLLHLLGLDAVTDLPLAPAEARVRVAHRQLRVAAPRGDRAQLQLRVVDLHGRTLLTAAVVADGREHAVPLGTLAAGVYAVQVGTGATLVRIP